MADTAQAKVLEIRNVGVSFSGVRALNDVSFGVPGGSIFGLIGSNGAGKTTLLNVVSSTLPPTEGSVFMQGRRVTGLPAHRVARIGVARTFQNVRLFGDQTVLENATIGTHRRTRSGMLSGMFAIPGAVAEQRRAREEAMECLEFVGLAKFADQEAEVLPFGRQRLLEFARALALNPWLLLLDEPAAGLNDAETAQLARLIAMLPSRGITVLLVEHDMTLMMSVADTIVVLSQGEKIAEGTPLEIQRNQSVIDAYLGEDVVL